MYVNAGLSSFDTRMLHPAGGTLLKPLCFIE